MIRSLPAEARLARLPGDEQEWSTDTELLALLVEEVSVLAADRRRKKPIEVNRPLTLTQAQHQGAGKVRGFRAFEKFAADAGRVRQT